MITSECVIYIGGDGPMTESIKVKCKSTRVRFLGRLTDQEMKYYYHAADVFTFPSYIKQRRLG